MNKNNLTCKAVESLLAGLKVGACSAVSAVIFLGGCTGTAIDESKSDSSSNSSLILSSTPVVNSSALVSSSAALSSKAIVSSTPVASSSLAISSDLASSSSSSVSNASSSTPPSVLPGFHRHVGIWLCFVRFIKRFNPFE